MPPSARGAQDREACEALADLLVADALDVLEGEDELRLRRHLNDCPACRSELDQLRTSASLLALNVPLVEPPTELRARVVEAAAHERRASLMDGLRRPLAAARRNAPVWGAVAAAFVISAGSLVWAASLQHQLTELNGLAQAERDKADRYDTVVRVLASQQLVLRPLSASTTSDTPPTGMVYLDPSSGSGMIMVHNLPPLPPGRAWQVWYVRGNERMSGGMMRTDASGAAYAFVVVPSNVQSFDAVGVTDEPAIGSDWPTTPRIVGTSL
jgi:hypothetical protein